jgi:hypothetical protein
MLVRRLFVLGWDTLYVEDIAYINNPVLRDRLVEITEAVYNSEKTMYEIFWNDAILKYPTMFQLTQYSYL